MSEDMRRELNDVKTRLNGIEDEARQTKKILRSLVIAVTKLSDSVDGINSYIKEKLVTKDEFHGRIDAFIRKQDEMRFDWGQHHVRLENHDKRLARLESRRA